MAETVCFFGISVLKAGPTTLHRLPNQWERSGLGPEVCFFHCFANSDFDLVLSFVVTP